MLEQVLDNQKLMQESIDLRFASLGKEMREGFASLGARVTALERTVAEHSRKIDALPSMILDNREAIEKNRKAIEQNREAIEQNRVAIEQNRAETAAVRKLVEGVDDRLRRVLEPRIDRIEARVDALERALDDSE